MPRPLIGLSAYRETAAWNAWKTPAILLHEEYPRAVAEAGGIPVLIPPDAAAASDVMARLDALVLTGGPDVGSVHYGHARHPESDPPHDARDTAELVLYRAARAASKPILGICRGLQLMAVAEGGALHQHLPDLTQAVHRERPATFTFHHAQFAAGSLIHDLLGSGVTVASSHHQAVSDPGGLTVTGWAEDGTVEACEDPAAPFVLGVQWHPEMSDDPRLFQALVAAARS